MIQFVCPRCGTRYEAQSGRAGEPARCPECGRAGIGRPAAEVLIDLDWPSTEDLGPPITRSPSDPQPLPSLE